MRTLTAPALAALSSGSVALALLVEMQLTVPLRLTTAAMNITHGSDVYSGTGLLGSIESVSDAAGQIKPIRFSLSGMPTDMMGLALAEPIRNKPCRMRLAILDAETHALLDAPITWTGSLEQMPVSHQPPTEKGPATLSISVTGQHRGATFGRPRPFRYTDSDQRKVLSIDTGLRFILSQSAHKDVWPSAAFGRK